MTRRHGSTPRSSVSKKPWEPRVKMERYAFDDNTQRYNHNDTGRDIVAEGKESYVELRPGGSLREPDPTIKSLRDSLRSVTGVVGVNIFGSFVTVKKAHDVRWEEINNQVATLIANHLGWIDPPSVTQSKNVGAN